MHLLASCRAKPVFPCVVIGLFLLTCMLPTWPSARAQEASKSVADDATVKPKELPAGAVVYSKPMQRGEHFYVWHGGWRDRGKGKKDVPLVPARADLKPARTAPVRPTAAPPITAASSVNLGKTGQENGSLSLLASDPRIATDLTTILNGSGVRVRIAANGDQSTGPKELLSAAYDLAVIPADALATEWHDAGAEATNRFQYVARLYTTEIHVVAPTAVTDLRQLSGKDVAVDVAGSATVHRVFDRLGIAASFSDTDLPGALDKLKNGASDAAIIVGGRSIAELTMLESGNFHFVAVPYEASLQQLYYPARLTDRDYPNLIAPGEGVDTVAVGTVLAVFDAIPGSVHYQKLAQATEALFDHFEALLKSPRHPKWREVNLAARLPEWSRFQAAEDWLGRNGTASIAPAAQVISAGNPPALAPSGDSSSIANPTDVVPNQEQLFKDFLTWKRNPIK
jgi:TRAP-type uncharacterized transport system substrate-binding protein